MKATAEGRPNLLIFVEPPPHSYALNQRVRTRMLWWCGEGARQRASLPDFVRFLVLVLSIAVLVLEAIQYINPAYWSATYREPLRSTIGSAAVQTAIEYEYRFTEYRPPRRTEYDYDEIRGEARAHAL